MIIKPKIISKPTTNRFNYNLGFIFNFSHGTSSGTSGNSNDGLAAVLDWFASSTSNASSNYVIAKNGDIYEIVDPALGYSAWANGIIASPNLRNSLLVKTIKITENINLNSISTEHVRSSAEMFGRKPMPDAQLEASLNLSLWLMQTYKMTLPEQHVEHADVDSETREFCPGFPNYDTYYRQPLLTRYKNQVTTKPKSLVLNGFTVEGEILQRWQTLEKLKLGLPTWGYPVSDAFTAPDGKRRQFFEKSTVVFDKNVSGVWRVQSEIIIR